MVYLWMEEEAGRKGKGFGEIFTAMGDGVAKQTVNTFMMRLSQKGFLVHEGREGKRLYYSNVSRQEYAFSLLHDLYPDMTTIKEMAIQDALEIPIYQYMNEENNEREHF